MTTFVAGLDEAGRGPALGSLCVGCVILEKKNLPLLEEIGVDDSKRLSAKKRVSLAKKIREIAKSWKVLEITPAMLNSLHNEGNTLNKIEEDHFAQLINEMTPRPHEIFLDAADVKEARFGQSIGKLLSFSPEKIVSKHKGDRKSVV